VNNYSDVMTIGVNINTSLHKLPASMPKSWENNLQENHAIQHESMGSKRFLYQQAKSPLDRIN